MVKEVPIYLCIGFIDSGKTTFINGAMQGDFTDGAKTLLICCEEGEVEYDFSDNPDITIVTVEEEREFNKDFLKDLQEKYDPDQVMIEYNGMWQMPKLFGKIWPDGWILYQIMTFVEASTFDLYSKNMGQLMMEKIRNCDMLVFNRCTEELKESLRKRNFRLVNKRADIYLDDVNGNAENYLTGDESPFDLTQDVIDIADNEFGVWYVDIMDKPKSYEGKKVHVKMQVYRPQKYPGTFSLGRFVMVCCEYDITFMSLIAKGDALNDFPNMTWVDTVCEISLGEHEAYNGTGPIMNVVSIEECKEPEDDVVSF